MSRMNIREKSSPSREHRRVQEPQGWREMLGSRDGGREAGDEGRVGGRRVEHPWTWPSPLCKVGPTERF